MIKIVSCAHAKGQKSLNDFKFGTFIGRFKAGLYQLGSRGGNLKTNEPGRLGTTQCQLVPTCLVKWVPHWNTLHTTKTSRTGQATSGLQRPLDPSTSGWLLLLFLYIPDGASPSSCCTFEQTILRPVSDSAASMAVEGLMLHCHRLMDSALRWARSGVIPCSQFHFVSSPPAKTLRFTQCWVRR